MKKFEKLNAALATHSFVRKFSIAYNPETDHFDLHLTISEEPDSGDCTRVLFSDVGELHCELPFGGWSQVNMLGIRHERPWFERPYLVEEVENSSLRFACTGAELIQDDT